MKNMLHHTLLVTTALLLFACNKQEETEQAFNEYEAFVVETENKANTDFTEIEIRAMRQSALDTSLWQKESAEIMQAYEEKKQRVHDNLDSYDEAQKQEIRELEARYTKAHQKQGDKYREVSHRYQLRKEMLGLPVSADDMSNITEMELGKVYDHFIEKLATKVNDLDRAEWEMVEGWWLALNNRKEELETKLSADTKSTINRATRKYMELREAEAPLE